MKTNITFQEAWASTIMLKIDFTHKGTKYIASARYFNDSGLDDIEVYQEQSFYGDVQESVFQIGKELLQDMDIDKHLVL